MDVMGGLTETSIRLFCSSISRIDKQVAESIQNASPVSLADELVTHLGVSLEG